MAELTIDSFGPDEEPAWHSIHVWRKVQLIDGSLASGWLMKRRADNDAHAEYRQETDDEANTRIAESGL